MVTRKIGIIGCGHMGEALAGGLSRRVRNAARTLAVFDIDKRKSEKLRRRYGVSPAADSR
jgi:pyrroline-5-carboxylate reductase